jgi:hypothetical protein
VYVPVAWKEISIKERLKSGYKLKWLQQHGQAIVSNPKKSRLCKIVIDETETVSNWSFFCAIVPDNVCRGINAGVL